MKRVTFLSALSIASAVLEVTALYLIALIATAIVRQSHSVTVSLPVIGSRSYSMADILMFASFVLVLLVALAYPLARTAASLSKTAQIRTRDRLVEVYMRSEWAARSNYQAGHIQTLLSEFTQKSENLVLALTTLIVALSNLAIVTMASLIVAPGATAIVLITLIAVGLFLRPLNRRVKGHSSTFVAANKQFATQIAETDRMSQEIAAFGVETAILKRLRCQIEDGGAKLLRLRTISRMIRDLYHYGLLALILLLVAILSNGDYSGLVAAGPVILIMVRALGYSRQAQGAIQSANTLIPYPDAIESEIARLARVRIGPQERPVHRAWELIEFRNVTFSYPNSGVVIADANLEVFKGEFVGIVGPSGSGKSTFIQLLMRLLKPQSGCINIDGVNLNQIDEASWRRLLAFVPQDNKLIYGKVADNIRFYRDGFDFAKVAEAASAAHLHEEIMRFPAGYDTVIGLGGRELSGGQRQRLGIARALLGKPAILVLDEPTSALDNNSERMLKATLEELKEAGQTLILVAHRPFLLEGCDRILTVSDGQVLSVATQNPFPGKSDGLTG